MHHSIKTLSMYASRRIGLRALRAATALMICCVYVFNISSSGQRLEPTSEGKAIGPSKQAAGYDALFDAIRSTHQVGDQSLEMSGPDALGESATLLAADGTADDRLGFSVAISGDTAIVGAFGDDIGTNVDQGSAYIFVRNGTTWTQQAQLTAADGAGSDFFGISVAISGDTAVVGADSDDVAGSFNQGSAYVFVRNGTTWTQQAQLNMPAGAANDFFGGNVAISGDTAVVGADSDDVGANRDQGSAFVFVRTGTTWALQSQLNAVGGAADDQFGSSVAISGDSVIVGAFADDVGTNGQQGSAYVFLRSGTTWTQQAQLNAGDGFANDFFGIAVAIDGETAVVGADGDDVGTNVDQGSAYVFLRSGTAWTQQARLNGADGSANDFFGSAVAISGDRAVVGADGDDVGSVVDQGSAYAFLRTGSTWAQQAQLVATGGASGDGFGSDVTISGVTAIVGAFGDDVAGNVDQGSAAVFVIPTAANVSLSGRVTTPDDRPLRNAVVSITDEQGNTRTTLTTSFGFYSFANVATGARYTIRVAAKRYRFTALVLQVNGELTDINFVAVE
ncbi:MAG: carboxypeptidase regulatory-like domain-containing protein [Pyrinomonadaceae bacterium]